MDIKSLPKSTTSIKVENTDINIEDMKLIGERTKLVGLALNNCPVTDEHISYLAGLSKMVNLEISGSCITDEALKYLTNMPKLRYLWMNNNPNLTGKGLAYLQESLIDCFWMAGTAFNDESLQIATRFRKLGTLGLNTTKITFDGLMAAAVNPRIKIIAKDLFTEEQMSTFEAEQRRLAKKTNLTLPTQELEKAKNVLNEFLKHLGEWDLYASSLPTEKTFSEETKQKCYDIYKKYSTGKTQNFGRPGMITGSNPPEYSYFKIIDSEALSKNRLYLYCKDTYSDTDYRFQMIKVNNEWRVESKQWMFAGWKKSYF